jgi:hypothetical protein
VNRQCEECAIGGKRNIVRDVSPGASPYDLLPLSAPGHIEKAYHWIELITRYQGFAISGERQHADTIVLGRQLRHLLS